MKCIPCRVTFEGFRYQIDANGAVFSAVNALRNEMPPRGAGFTDLVDDPAYAQEIRSEASRQRRNRNRRARHQAMLDIGLLRARGGAFGGYE